MIHYRPRRVRAAALGYAGTRRYPQLHSRVGFVPRSHALDAEESRQVIAEQPQLLGVNLTPEAFGNPEAVAAIVRITGGNFRLIQRPLLQVERVLEINQLDVATP